MRIKDQPILPMARTVLRILLRSFFVVTGILLAFGWYLYLKDYRADFRLRKGSLQETREISAGGASSFARSWLTLHSSSGLTVECGMLRPLPRRGQLSAIVLLGGKVTGKHAIDYAEGITDALIIAVDYPYEPRATYSAFEMLRDVPSVRRALLDMVPSVMLVIDYLWTQPDIDASSVILIGYSFGAQLVPVIFANDPRPSVAVMVYGGGDLQQLIRHNVRRYKDAFTSEVVAGLGAVLLHPLEPLRHAREISPRPLLMVNGTADEQIPRECPEKLFDEALPPKKIIWLKSAHVHPKGVELRREIADTLKVELKRVGMLR